MKLFVLIIGLSNGGDYALAQYDSMLECLGMAFAIQRNSSIARVECSIDDHQQIWGIE